MAEKITQERLYDLLASKEPSWQAMIYELVKTEQLDPWDIDIVVLANKFLEKIMLMQQSEEQALFISSKVLLAAAILLRMKSEILLENIKNIEEILEEKKIEIAKTPQINIPVPQELELGEIFIKTPLPRTRKVTLQELMIALERAINTEQRRIKRKLTAARIRRELENFIPRPILNLPKKIRELWARLKSFFYKEKKEKILFSQLLSTGTKEEKIATFVPLVFLDHQKKIWIQQEKPFSEIEIWMRKKEDLSS